MHILHQSFPSLPFSDNFKQMAQMYGFADLSELLSFSYSSLLNLSAFTPAMRQELMIFLEQHQLVQYLKEY